MISRRDKLLIKPWEQRKYEYHRKKVQTAIPVIDVGPPPRRFHVSYKLKKQQKELERCEKIEKDNLKLLQRLRNLMTSTRIDNNWTNAQPNFLNKVKIFNNNKSLSSRKKLTSIVSVENEAKYIKCVACAQKNAEFSKVSEQKPTKIEKPAEKSPTIAIKSSLPNSSKNSRNSSGKNISLNSQPVKNRSQSSRSNKKSLKLIDNCIDSKCVVLSRGEIKLEVMCPIDTKIKFKNTEEKIISMGSKNCYCSAIRT